MASIISSLISVLDKNRELTESKVKERYQHVWQMDQPLNAKAVLLPKTTTEISEILSICNQDAQPVVVHGGLTNLVGSTETSPNEIAISMEKMHSIEEVDSSSRTITVQAGAILENVQQAAAENGLLLPLNFH